MRTRIKIWFILLAFITPWFWKFSYTGNIFKIDLETEISDARSIVDWERGKVPPSGYNLFFSNYIEKLLNQRIEVVFENLDIGNYFFSGHPRERLNFEEIQKFFFFQFILFIIGLTSKSLKKYKKSLAVYLLFSFLLIFIFQLRTYNETIFLSLPPLFVMSLGFEKLINSKKCFLYLFSALVVCELVLFCLINRFCFL